MEVNLGCSLGAIPDLPCSRSHISSYSPGLLDIVWGPSDDPARIVAALSLTASSVMDRCLLNKVMQIARSNLSVTRKLGQLKGSFGQVYAIHDHA